MTLSYRFGHIIREIFFVIWVKMQKSGRKSPFQRQFLKPAFVKVDLDERALYLCFSRV